jgi:hypothetical protein
MAAAWIAFVFRPDMLRVTDQTPALNRVGLAAVGMIYTFGVATLAVIMAILTVGFVTGLSRGLS